MVNSLPTPRPGSDGSYAGENYFQYINVPAHKTFEWGYRRGNPHHNREEYLSQKDHTFKAKVRLKSVKKNVAHLISPLLSAEVVRRVRRPWRTLLRHQPRERLQGARAPRASLCSSQARIWTCQTLEPLKHNQHPSSLFVCNHLSLQFVPFYK